ncbi:hypothetical protein [Hyphomicrobium sp.]|uniref:hypothetical protein n=1 Tax=Hyphomicrobium sp. TaxID=82 RepID=UPI0025C191C8|nr:hypothetical protein [Hyphomicrobium sp.]MCC7252541.1 hypothetical protein [Hyphomicrobium sp.]
MKSSLLTKLTLAAAATMITLTPALADWRGKSNHSHGYHHSYGKHTYHDYKKRKHAQRHFHNHRHFGHRHWKPRFYAWRHGYNPYRGW